MAVVWWLLDSRYSSPSCSPRSHRLTSEGCNHWCLWDLCLLVWQEILHFSLLRSVLCKEHLACQRPPCFISVFKPLSSVQSLSRVWLLVTPWIAAHQASCPSPTPRVYSNPCPSSRWCHPAISSFVVPFSFCPQSLPASGSFPMSHLFAWGGQSIGVSASTSVLPMNTQNWSLLGWTGLISLQSKGLSRVFCNTTVQKHQIFSAQLSSQPNSHIHTWPLEKS